ncbi:MAG: hypothetical protein P9L99_19890 [Candidatus Lernaella stagnicola]|nr:hypothetical protein [Candidatus Lernaella stagnicola]
MLQGRRLFSLTLVLALFFLFSCHAENRILRKQENLQEELMKAALDFNRMVAWRYYDEAVQMVIPERQPEFMMAAEQVYARVHMESYKVTYAAVSAKSFPYMPGEVAAPEPGGDRPETPVSLQVPDKEKQKAADAVKRKHVPKVWYGLVLVRFVNLNVAPSSSVRSPLIRQYWYWYEDADTWMVDPDIGQLLNLGKPPAADRPQDKRAPQPAAPVVPAP